LRRGLAPDHVVFEGKLGPVAQEIADALEQRHGLTWMNFRKHGKEVLTFVLPGGQQIGLKTRWSTGREEWSCAILSAAWSLCRAGIMEFPKNSIVHLTEAPVVGTRIVSVLHEKYRGVEAKVLQLIESAGFQEVTNRLELVFFE
jgi:hypothetical protein